MLDQPSIVASDNTRAMAETSLDPANWDDFRARAHASLDAALDLVQGVRERPVWQAMSGDVKAVFAEPLPWQAQGTGATIAAMHAHVLPYATGNIHPRFWGWVHGTGTPGGIIAEMTAAAMNCNAGGREHAAVYVERQVIEWSRELFGMPASTSGLLTAGTSMATLIGLTVARNKYAGHDVRAEGMRDAPCDLVAYTSAEAHASVAKALELLGLGRRALRSIAVDAGHRMDMSALAAAIAADRAAGRQPFAVVATAGTVNTGAIDPIAAIADLCAAEGLWLHVDGAFGAPAILNPDLAPRLAGIERADSLAFDFHKWLHVPYDAGCILVRDGALHQAAFSTRPAYLAGAARGLAAGEPWLCEFGPELSRGFRALKVWFTLKEHGLTRLGAQIAQNCRQAAHLTAAVDQHPLLERLGPAPLNIVCFRHTPTGVPGVALDALNEAIVVALQERGIAAPSTTRIKGTLAIRICLTNHRTRTEDLDLLVQSVIAIGDEIHARTPA